MFSGKLGRDGIPGLSGRCGMPRQPDHHYRNQAPDQRAEDVVEQVIDVKDAAVEDQLEALEGFGEEEAGERRDQQSISGHNQPDQQADRDEGSDVDEITPQ